MSYTGRITRQVVHLLLILSREKLNINEIAKTMNVSERTVYRMLNVLSTEDIPLEIDFHNKYFIAADNCVLCGLRNKQTKHKKKWKLLKIN